MRFEHFATVAAAESPETPTAARADFEETSLGLSDTGEAGRCLSCGHCTHCDTCLVYCPEGAIERTADGYAVALDFCKGCGICAAECPRDGMEMVPV
jgi:Pyruvate/2-oxoacid:ferredoxin oxidoreductase delta subunit